MSGAAQGCFQAQGRGTLCEGIAVSNENLPFCADLTRTLTCRLSVCQG